MQPFDLFKERLVLYRMTPEVSALGYEVVARPGSSLTRSIARARLTVAIVAAVAMTALVVGVLVTH